MEDVYKIVLVVIAIFQVVMIFLIIPLVNFLLNNQKTFVNLENRLGSLEKLQVSPEKRAEESGRLAKMEIYLDQGDKRMGNIEKTLRLLLDSKLHHHHKEEEDK